MRELRILRIGINVKVSGIENLKNLKSLKSLIFIEIKNYHFSIYNKSNFYGQIRKLLKINPNVKIMYLSCVIGSSIKDITHLYKN